jgi:phage terminase large subunit-like protein
MLTAADREIIAELDALTNEYNRRHREDRLKYYNTGKKVHHKQLEFHACPKRNRWMLGGNRTGKTECGAAEAAYWARGNHPYRRITRPTDGWVVSLTNEVQRDVAQKKLLSYLNPAWIVDVKTRMGRADDLENAIIDYILVESIHGGVSRIGFKSCDQGRGKFQGTSLDWVWFDEEPPEEIYQECQMRIIDRRGDIWGTMTPLMGLTWVHDVIYLNERNDPNVWCGSMQWSDNPWLSDEEIRTLEATMTDEEREARQYGRFVAMSGLVYKEFNEQHHVIDPFPVPREWYDTISIDPGLEHPLSCHFYACDHDGTVYVVAEHHQAGWNVEQHAAAIKDIATKLDWPRDSRGRLTGIIDAAATQKVLAAEKTVLELFEEQGFALRPTTAQEKVIWSGVQRVKQFLTLREANDKQAWPRGKPRLFVFRNCVNMIREFKSYRWKPDSDSTPIAIKDDAMDDLRYYIAQKPEAYVAPVQKTEIQRHKEELARRSAANRRRIGRRW